MEFSFIAVDKSGEISKGDRKREYNYAGDFWTKYDDKGNRIEYNRYKSDGILDYRHTYKYDNEDNPIEKNLFKPDGSLFYTDTYKYDYDNKKNWIKRIEFRDDIPRFILVRKIEYYD